MSGDIKSSPTKNYEVGYKKPPKSTQFKKGQSGNPKGRRKGSKNKNELSYNLPPELYKAAILDEAYREISINEPSGPVPMKIHQAILRSVMLKAAKGHIGATKLALELIEKTERQNRKDAETRADFLIEYKRHWTERLSVDSTVQPDGPHPDQIILDSATGEMKIVGPLSAEDREKNEFYKAMLKNKKDVLEILNQDLENQTNATVIGQIRSEIDQIQTQVQILEEFVYDPDEDVSPYQFLKKSGLQKAYIAGQDKFVEAVKEKFSAD